MGKILAHFLLFVVVFTSRSTQHSFSIQMIASQVLLYEPSYISVVYHIISKRITQLLDLDFIQMVTAYMLILSFPSQHSFSVSDFDNCVELNHCWNFKQSLEL